MRTNLRLQSLLQTQRELIGKELWLYSKCNHLFLTHKVIKVTLPRKNFGFESCINQISAKQCFLQRKQHERTGKEWAGEQKDELEIRNRFWGNLDIKRSSLWSSKRSNQKVLKSSLRGGLVFEGDEHKQHLCFSGLVRSDSIGSNALHYLLVLIAKFDLSHSWHLSSRNNVSIQSMCF